MSTRWSCNDVVDVMGWPHLHCPSCEQDSHLGEPLFEEYDDDDTIELCCDCARKAEDVMGEVWARLRDRARAQDA